MQHVINLSQGQHRKIGFNGFLYVKAENTALHLDRLAWRCTKRKAGCNGRIWTNRQHQNPVVRVPHNHDPDEDQINAKVIMNNIKQRGEETLETPSQIVSHCVRGAAQPTLDALATKASCK